jgi:pantothenate synthetase
MKTINGKLLGQTTSDSDTFKQQLETIERQLNEVQESFQELGHRVERTENMLAEESQRQALLQRFELYVQHLKERCENLECLFEEKQKQIKTYQTEVKTMQLLFQTQEKRLDYLELIKLNQLEKKLLELKKQIPTKMLWLTFSSSLVVGIASFCNWFDINPANYRPSKTKSFLSSSELIKDRTHSSNESNYSQLVASIINK